MTGLRSTLQLAKWEDDILLQRENIDVVLDSAWKDGYRSGADDKAKACIEWISMQLNCTDQEYLVPHLREFLSKPLPTESELALEALDRFDQLPMREDKLIIRNALERLQELEAREALAK
jgi:hypothetical protein